MTFSDSMTTDCVTSSGSVDSDYKPLATSVKTLTYTSTDSTPPDDYNIPRKEHQTSEKSNEYETETSETQSQSDELRNEIAKEMFDQQSKKTNMFNAAEKEAPPLVELGESQEEMVGGGIGGGGSGGGVAEDNHDKSEQRTMYRLRLRERKGSGQKLGTLACLLPHFHTYFTYLYIIKCDNINMSYTMKLSVYILTFNSLTELVFDYNQPVAPTQKDSVACRNSSTNY